MIDPEDGGTTICRSVQNSVLTDSVTSQKTRICGVNEFLWGRKADRQQET